MARIADEVIAQLKREISVQRLAEGRGVKLKRQGKDLMGLCPFHKDTNPSLSINPEKNEWNCLGACGKGGDVIAWVMHAEGISFRHAVELLRRDVVPVASPSAGAPPKKCTVPKLPPLIESATHADDKKLLEGVVSHYEQTLKNTPDAQQYLLKRGLNSSAMVAHFRLGFANRTLGYALPASNRAAGAQVRGRLEQLGVLRENGREHLHGSLVIPIFNLQGEVVQMYGRKITRGLREGTPEHLYLPGPLRGVWNKQALIASQEIILCEALIDALTFWRAGYHNVTSIYGVNGFTDELRTALKQFGTKRIYLAYDRDDAGEQAAQVHAAELMEMGIECFRVQFPKGMDANEYALKVQLPGKALGVMLHGAAWLGKGKPPAVRVPGVEQAEEVLETSVLDDRLGDANPRVPQQAPGTGYLALESSVAKETTKEEASAHVKPNIPVVSAAAGAAAKEKGSLTASASNEAPKTITVPGIATESVFPLAAIEEAMPQQAADPQTLLSSSTPIKEAVLKIEGEEITFTRGDRRYRILGLGKNMSHGVLRVNVLVSRSNGRGDLLYFGDTFDLCSARPRLLFAKQAAEELGVKEEILRRELGAAWMRLEEMQRQQIEKALTPQPTESGMTEEDKAAALELLRDPRLLERVVSDFEKCGIVGEETNKKVSYLAAVSRLLHKPLAIVVQSSSAAGKSSLMEAVLDFMPEEQREEYSAMTGQALFYMGEKNLKNKILAVSEEEGASRAAYALKLLQSEGVLKIASTGKDPVSGKLVTHEYRVEGPVMIFLTTTAQDVDEELLNRSIVLTVNEEREQTQAIHRKQRQAQTREGLWARRDRAKIVTLHRNAQRLLRPIEVVNEHVSELEFPDYMTRTRRDHMKLLTLIHAIALLHQHQREIKTETRHGETLEYIEATEADVELARKLVNEVLAPSLDELQAQTRRLLMRIEQMVMQACEQLQMERCDYRFTRATVRQYTRWSDSQLKTHLHRLEELEYLQVHRGGRGQSYLYELNFELDASEKPSLPGLRYRYDAKKSGVNDHPSGPEEEKSGPSLAQVWGVSGGGLGEPSPVMARTNVDFCEKSEKNTYRENRGSAETGPVVAIAKPNGKMHAVAGVK